MIHQRHISPNVAKRAGGHPHGRSTDPIHDLWCCVLKEGLRNHFGIIVCAHPTEVAGADEWVGTPDFHEVCERADFDPDCVMDWVRREERAPNPGRCLMNKGWPEALQYRKRRGR